MAWRATVSDYVTISKPRIMLLLLIVAWASMFVATEGLPDPAPFVGVTVAGILSTASSGAFNNVLEKDRDAKMGRTADRAVASGRIPVSHAVTYASITGALSFAALAVLELWLAAALTVGAIAYYVLVYTALLKPTTPQNIVIGGLAGSFPALIGWAAVTGTVGWPAVVLAAVVFFWTPAHFWALALLYKEDYAAADYPMMPSIQGDESTKQQMLAYAILAAAVSFLLVPLGAAGILYGIGALWLGVTLVWRCAKLIPQVPRAQYRAFFLYTIQYLGLLLVLLMADQLLISIVPQTQPF